MPYLAIQLIDITYSKRERGGEAATRRAQIPHALPLPVIAGSGVLHDCRLAAWDDYEPRTMVSGVPLRDGMVALGGRVRLFVGERLRFAGDPGAEAWRSEPMFELAPGAWGRVIWNEVRYQGDARLIGEIIVNAGLFSAPPDANVFAGEPAESRDLRRDLWRTDPDHHGWPV